MEKDTKSLLSIKGEWTTEGFEILVEIFCKLNNMERD